MNKELHFILTVLVDVMIQKKTKMRLRRTIDIKKDKLYESYVEFERSRSLRHERRSSRIAGLSHYDLISIDFLKMVGDQLAREIERKYGLAAVNFRISIKQYFCYNRRRTF